MDVLSSFFGRSGFLPHGYFFTWTPGLLWSMVIADAVIALAYFSIPIAIIVYVRQRKIASHTQIGWLFGAFIFACGATHVMDMWTIWKPDYGLLVLIKVITAVLSIVTAIMLWPLIPRALKIPSVEQLQSVIKKLEEEVGRRKTAEEHVVDLGQSLSAALASIGAGFIVTNRAGQVTRMNALAEQLTGWPLQDALGRALLAVFVPEGEKTDNNNWVDLLIERGGSGQSAEHMVVVARDGCKTPLEVKAVLIREDDGSVSGMAMVLRDLTPMRLAQAEIQRLAAIVESSFDAIIAKKLSGEITSWNEAAETMFGYTAEEAVGQKIQMLIPDDRAQEEMLIISSLARGEVVRPFDTRRRSKGGQLVEVSVSLSPIRDGLGRIVGASNIVRDISQQKAAEAALRASEARLRFVMDEAKIGDWDLDLASGATRRSLRHDKCFGYDVAQSAWSIAIFLDHVHPEDRQAAQKDLQEAETGSKGYHTECRVIWPDETVHWISASGSITATDGKPTQMLGIIFDITEQKLAEETRLKALRLEVENRDIRESSRIKSLFLANMSHELRTPLSSIIGFADLLRGRSVPFESPKYGEFLGYIGTSGRHLLGLINDVLDLAKVESGKFEFFPEPVDLGRLLRAAAGAQHDAVTRKSLSLEIDIDPDLTGLVIDPARLKQVLYNYLSNAIKFTAENGRVILRAMPEGTDSFLIEVEDTGIGISDQNLPRLFVEFEQLDGSYNKHYQGTGLGLALTRRLVEAQGGSVGVRSVEGEGSVFFLVLPRVHRKAAKEDPAARTRLLVIENDPAIQSSMKSELARAGYQVSSASTGAQAMDSVQNQSCALTLSLQLPDTGLGTLAGIRLRWPDLNFPVLALSMDSPDGKAASFAIANLLRKPIHADEVAFVMQQFKPGKGQTVKVMVIDDDPMALDLMKATLTSLGIDSVGLQDGRQALRDIDQHLPDAIILDLMMPGFDGFEVLDALQHLARWRDTPVFVWTSMILTEDEYAQLARSAQAILSKGGGNLAAMLGALGRRAPVSQLEGTPS